MEMNMPVSPMPFATGGMGSFGNDWMAFLIFALIFGYGDLGGRGKGNYATESFVANQFDYTNLTNGIQGISQGINSLGNGICDLGYNMATQISGVKEAVTASSWNTERGLDGIARSIADCCCETNRNIDALRYESAKNTCDIITNANNNTRDLIAAGNANTQRLVDMMTQNELQALRDQNNALTLQVSQAAQTKAIIDALSSNKPTA